MPEAYNGSLLMADYHTKVINLLGGPGCGKSTMAAELFAWMKQRNISCELVREYVKDWAWENRRIEPLAQAHVFGEQSYRESRLYGKVEYIITDSPLILCGFYQGLISEYGNYITDLARQFMEEANELYGVTYHSFTLERRKPYDPAGRYETANQAIERDEEIRRYAGHHFYGFSRGEASTKEEIISEMGLEDYKRNGMG